MIEGPAQEYAQGCPGVLPLLFPQIAGLGYGGLQTPPSEAGYVLEGLFPFFAGKGVGALKPEEFVGSPSDPYFSTARQNAHGQYSSCLEGLYIFAAIAKLTASPAHSPSGG